MRLNHTSKYSSLEPAKKARQIENKDKSDKTGSASGVVKTLDDYIQKVTPFGINHPTARRITQAVAEMIALDNQSFSIVDDLGFKNLVQVLEPRYNLPSCRYFAEVIIPDMYQQIKERIVEFLKQQDFLSCTTDLWSSVAQDSMLSLTTHCICLDFSRKSFVLQSREFNDSHTGENIANLIASCLQSWKIEDKLVCIVRDNGSNFVAGLQDACLPNISCLAHTLQLVIDDGVFAQPYVVDLLAADRRLVGHFKRSNANMHALSRIQEQLSLNKHQLIQDEPTRWNTSYYMWSV